MTFSIKFLFCVKSVDYILSFVQIIDY